jgi:hypothetical protein
VPQRVSARSLPSGGSAVVREWDDLYRFRTARRQLQRRADRREDRLTNHRCGPPAEVTPHPCPRRMQYGGKLGILGTLLRDSHATGSGRPAGKSVSRARGDQKTGVRSAFSGRSLRCQIPLANRDWTLARTTAGVQRFGSGWETGRDKHDETGRERRKPGSRKQIQAAVPAGTGDGHLARSTRGFVPKRFSPPPTDV